MVTPIWRRYGLPPPQDPSAFGQRQQSSGPMTNATGQVPLTAADRAYNEEQERNRQRAEQVTERSQNYQDAPWLNTDADEPWGIQSFTQADTEFIPLSIWEDYGEQIDQYFEAMQNPDDPANAAYISSFQNQIFPSMYRSLIQYDAYDQPVQQQVDFTGDTPGVGQILTNNVFQGLGAVDDVYDWGRNKVNTWAGNEAMDVASGEQRSGTWGPNWQGWNPFNYADDIAYNIWSGANAAAADLGAFDLPWNGGFGGDDRGFQDWVNANPETARRASERGGGREVWETYIDTQGKASRMFQDTAGDPLFWASLGAGPLTRLPKVGGAFKVVADLIELPDDILIRTLKLPFQAVAQVPDLLSMTRYAARELAGLVPGISEGTYHPSDPRVYNWVRDNVVSPFLEGRGAPGPESPMGTPLTAQGPSNQYYRGTDERATNYLGNVTPPASRTANRAFSTGQWISEVPKEMGISRITNRFMGLDDRNRQGMTQQIEQRGGDAGINFGVYDPRYMRQERRAKFREQAQQKAADERTVAQAIATRRAEAAAQQDPLAPPPPGGPVYPAQHLGRYDPRYEPSEQAKAEFGEDYRKEYFSALVADLGAEHRDEVEFIWERATPFLMQVAGDTRRSDAFNRAEVMMTFEEIVLDVLGEERIPAYTIANTNETVPGWIERAIFSGNNEEAADALLKLEATDSVSSEEIDHVMALREERISRRLNREANTRQRKTAARNRAAERAQATVATQALQAQAAAAAAARRATPRPTAPVEAEADLVLTDTGAITEPVPNPYQATTDLDPRSQRMLGTAPLPPQRPQPTRRVPNPYGRPQRISPEDAAQLGIGPARDQPNLPEVDVNEPALDEDWSVYDEDVGDVFVEDSYELIDAIDQKLEIIEPQSQVAVQLTDLRTEIERLADAWRAAKNPVIFSDGTPMPGATQVEGQVFAGPTDPREIESRMGEVRKIMTQMGMATDRPGLGIGSEGQIPGQKEFRPGAEIEPAATGETAPVQDAYLARDMQDEQLPYAATQEEEKILHARWKQTSDDFVRERDADITQAATVRFENRRKTKDLRRQIREEEEKIAAVRVEMESTNNPRVREETGPNRIKRSEGIIAKARVSIAQDRARYLDEVQMKARMRARGRQNFEDLLALIGEAGNGIEVDTGVASDLIDSPGLQKFGPIVRMHWRHMRDQGLAQGWLKRTGNDYVKFNRKGAKGRFDLDRAGINSDYLWQEGDDALEGFSAATIAAMGGESRARATLREWKVVHDQNPALNHLRVLADGPPVAPPGKKSPDYEDMTAYDDAVEYFATLYEVEIDKQGDVLDQLSRVFRETNRAWVEMNNQTGGDGKYADLLDDRRYQKDWQPPTEEALVENAVLDRLMDLYESARLDDPTGTGKGRKVTHPTGSLDYWSATGIGSKRLRAELKKMEPDALRARQAELAVARDNLAAARAARTADPANRAVQEQYTQVVNQVAEANWRVQEERMRLAQSREVQAAFDANPASASRIHDRFQQVEEGMARAATYRQVKEREIYEELHNGFYGFDPNAYFLERKPEFNRMMHEEIVRSPYFRHANVSPEPVFGTDPVLRFYEEIHPDGNTMDLSSDEAMEAAIQANGAYQESAEALNAEADYLEFERQVAGLEEIEALADLEQPTPATHARTIKNPIVGAQTMDPGWSQPNLLDKNRIARVKRSLAGDQNLYAVHPSVRKFLNLQNVVAKQAFLQSEMLAEQVRRADLRNAIESTPFIGGTVVTAISDFDIDLMETEFIKHSVYTGQTYYDVWTSMADKIEAQAKLFQKLDQQIKTPRPSKGYVGKGAPISVDTKLGVTDPDEAFALGRIDTKEREQYNRLKNKFDMWGGPDKVMRQDAAGNWTMIDRKLEMMRRDEFHKALQMELLVKQNETWISRLGAKYDRLITAWAQGKLLSPLAITRFLTQNMIGNTFQLFASHEGEAAFGQFGLMRKMFNEYGVKMPGSWRKGWFSPDWDGPTYDLTDTLAGDVLEQAQFGLMPAQLQVTSITAQTGQKSDKLSRAAAKARDQKPPGKIRRYFDAAGATMSAMESSARVALWTHHFANNLTLRKNDMLAQTLELNTRYKIGLVEQDITDMYATIGPIMGPVTLANNLERLMTLRGISHPKAKNFLTRNARDWANMQNAASDDALKRVNKVLFSYEYNNVDSLARKVMPFHFWATRALPFYVDIAVRNPWLVNAYLNFADGLKKTAEDENAPGYVQQAISILDSPFGYSMFFNPITAIGMIAFFEADMGDAPDGETWLGKIMRVATDKSGLMVYPWIGGIANYMGLMGQSNQYLDPTGYQTERNKLGSMIQLLQAQGWWPGESNLMGAPVQQMLNNVRQLTSSLFGNEVEPRNVEAGKEQDLTYLIMDLVAERDGVEEGVPLTMDQIEEVMDARDNGDSELYQEALDLYANGGGLTSLLNSVIPGYIVSQPEMEGETQQMSEQAWDAVDDMAFQALVREETGHEATGNYDLVPSQQRARLQGQVASATSEHAELLYQQTEYFNVGTQAQRGIVETYRAIRSGTLEQSVTIGDQRARADAVNGLDPESRRQIANDWLGDDPEREAAFTRYYDQQDAYLRSHPELAAYYQWRETVEANGSLERYRNEISANNESARRYFDAERTEIVNQRPGITARYLMEEMDDRTTTLEAYEAVTGIRRSLFDPVYPAAEGVPGSYDPAAQAGPPPQTAQQGYSYPTTQPYSGGINPFKM